jgi:hypothetical protein
MKSLRSKIYEKTLKNLNFVLCGKLVNCSTQTYGVWYCKTSRMYLQVLFDEACKHRDGGKLVGYVGTNIEPLCIEFCNFVQCCISVNYLIFALNDEI